MTNTSNIDRSQIKNFSDLCKALGENPNDYVIPPDASTRKAGTISFSKAQLIVEAANEGWEADPSDRTQRKYEILWWYQAGSGFSYDVCDDAGTGTAVGARLQFKDVEAAKWAAATFPAEWNEFLIKTPVQK